MKTMNNAKMILNLGSARTLLKGDRAFAVAVDGYVQTETRKEYHRVWFSPREWDAYAEAETVIRVADRLEVTGTLNIPESGEAHHYVHKLDNGQSYDQGLMKDPTVTDFVPSAGIIKTARIKKHGDLPCYEVK